MIDFIFRQVANLLRVIDIRLGGEFLRALLPDAIDRSQPNPKALLRRKIYTCDTCHAILLKSLSLALLVLRVDANYPHHAAPVDHLAFVTNLFYRCPNFHKLCSPMLPNFVGPRALVIYSGTQSARASNRTAKAPLRLCLPPESG